MADSFLERELDGATPKTKYTSDENIGGIFLDEIYNHKTRHEDGGSDEVDTTGLVGHQYGRNLVPHTAFFDLNGDDLPVIWELEGTPTLVIAPTTLFVGSGGNMITITGTGAANEGIKVAGGTANPIKILPSTIYSISFDYAVNAGDSLNFRYAQYDGAVLKSTVIMNLTETTETTHVVTFTSRADATNLEIVCVAAASGDIVKVAHMKVEQGASATPYALNEAEEQANIIQFFKPYARVYLGTDQDDLNNGVFTKVLLDTVSFDLGSIVDVGNNKIVTPVTGIYRITAQVTYEGTDIVANRSFQSNIYTDGAAKATLFSQSAIASADLALPVFYFNKIDENIDIELYTKQNTGVNTQDLEGISAQTFMEIELVTLDI